MFVHTSGKYPRMCRISRLAVVEIDNYYTHNRPKEWSAQPFFLSVLVPLSPIDFDRAIYILYIHSMGFSTLNTYWTDAQQITARSHSLRTVIAKRVIFRKKIISDNSPGRDDADTAPP